LNCGLQELIAIQQNGPKALGFFGTRNMGFLHQNLIEILSYAMVLTVRTCVLPRACRPGAYMHAHGPAGKRTPALAH
jgi:hypothetical protein